jgi:NTE family protein
MDDEKEVWGYVASGGGAKGAWSGGVSEYLTTKLNRDYQHLAGSSTGNLLMNLVALKKIKLLRQAYTTVSNKDIYKLAPFTLKKNEHGLIKTKANYFKIAWNIFFRRKKTFGDSTNLRKNVIPQFLTKDDYETALALNKEIIACVTNLTLGKPEYKSNMDEGMTYEDFMDWVFASAAAAPIMSIVEKDNYEYADGAFTENAPIQVLIDRGCTHIDVIILRPPSLEIEKIRNPLHLVNRIMNIMMFEASAASMELAKLKAKDKDVQINIYQTPRRLTSNSLVFDKKQMNSWWKEGYEFAKAQECKSWCISKRKKPRKVTNDSNTK